MSNPPKEKKSNALTQQQNMRMLHRQLRKNDPIPQPIRQLSNRRRLVRPSEPKPAQLGPPRLNILLRVLLAEQTLEVLDGVHVVRELVGRVL